MAIQDYDKLSGSFLDRINTDIDPDKFNERTLVDSLMSKFRTSYEQQSISLPGNQASPGYNSRPKFSTERNRLNPDSSEGFGESIVRGGANLLYGFLDGATLGALDLYLSKNAAMAPTNAVLKEYLGDDGVASWTRGIGSAVSIFVPYAGIAKGVSAGVKGAGRINMLGKATGSTKQGVEAAVEMAIKNGGAGREVLKGVDVAKEASRISGNFFKNKKAIEGLSALENARPMAVESMNMMKAAYRETMGKELSTLLKVDAKTVNGIIDESFDFMSKGGWKHVNSLEQLVLSKAQNMIGFDNIMAHTLTGKFLRQGVGFTSSATQAYVVNLAMMGASREIQKAGLGEDEYNRLIGDKDNSIFYEALILAGIGGVANRIGGGLDKGRIRDFNDRVLRPWMNRNKNYSIESAVAGKANVKSYQQLARTPEGRQELVNIARYRDQVSRKNGFSMSELFGVNGMAKLRNSSGGDIGEELAKGIAKGLSKYDRSVRMNNLGMFAKDTAKDLLGSAPRIVADGYLSYKFLLEPQGITLETDPQNVIIDLVQGAFLAKARGRSPFDVMYKAQTDTKLAYMNGEGVGSYSMQGVRYSYETRENYTNMYHQLMETYNLDKRHVESHLNIQNIYDDTGAAYGKILDNGGNEAYGIMKEELDVAFKAFSDEYYYPGMTVQTDPNTQAIMNRYSAKELKEYMLASEDYRLVKYFYDQLYVGGAIREYVQAASQNDPNSLAIANRVREGGDIGVPIQYLSEGQIKNIASRLRNVTINVGPEEARVQKKLGDFGDPRSMLAEIEASSAEIVRGTYIDGIKNMESKIKDFLTDNGIDINFGLKVNDNGRTVTVETIDGSNTAENNTMMSLVNDMLATLGNLGIIDLQVRGKDTKTGSALDTSKLAQTLSDRNLLLDFNRMVEDEYNMITFNLFGGEDSPYMRKVGDPDRVAGYVMPNGYTTLSGLPMNHSNVEASPFLGLYARYRYAVETDDMVNIISMNSTTSRKATNDLVDKTRIILKSDDGVRTLNNITIVDDNNVPLDKTADNIDHNVLLALQNLNNISAVMGEVNHSGNFSQSTHTISLGELMEWNELMNVTGIAGRMSNIAEMTDGTVGTDFIDAMRMAIHEKALNSANLSPEKMALLHTLVGGRGAFLRLNRDLGTQIDGIDIIGRDMFRNMLMSSDLNDKVIEDQLAVYDNVVGKLGTSIGNIKVNQMQGESMTAVIDGRPIEDGWIGVFEQASRYLETAQRNSDVDNAIDTYDTLIGTFGENAPSTSLRVIYQSISDSQTGGDVMGVITGLDQLGSMIRNMYDYQVNNGIANAASLKNIIDDVLPAIDAAMQGMRQEIAQVITKIEAERADMNALSPQEFSKRVKELVKQDSVLKTKLDAMMSSVTPNIIGADDIIKHSLVSNMDGVIKFVSLIGNASKYHGNEANIFLQRQAQIARAHLMNEIGSSITETDVPLSDLLAKYAYEGKGDISQMADMVLRSLRQAVYTEDQFMLRERVSMANEALRHAESKGGNYSLNTLIAEYGIIDGGSLFANGKVDIARINSLRMALDPRTYMGSGEDQLKNLDATVYNSLWDSMEADIYAGIIRGRKYGNKAITPEEEAQIRRKITVEIIPQLIKSLTQTEGEQIRFDVVNGNLIATPTRVTMPATGARTRLQNKADTVFHTTETDSNSPGQQRDLGRLVIFEVDDNSTTIDVDSQEGFNRKQVPNMSSDKAMVEKVNSTTGVIIGTQTIQKSISESINRASAQANGIASGIDALRVNMVGESKNLAQLAGNVYADIDIEGTNNGFILINVSPKSAVAVQRTPDNMLRIKHLGIKYLEDIRAAGEKAVSEGRLDADRYKAAMKTLDTVVGHHLNKTDAEFMTQTNNNAVSAIMNMMYNYEQFSGPFLANVSGIKDGKVLSGKEWGSMFAKNAKYQGTVESSAAKEFGDPLMSYLSTRVFNGTGPKDTQIRNLLMRWRDKGMNVVVFGDETDPTGKMLHESDDPVYKNSIMSARAAHIRGLERALADEPEGSPARAVIEKNLEMAKDNSEKGLFPSLDSSTVNGSVMLSRSAYETILAANGIPFEGNDAGGVKSVIDFNDAETARTFMAKNNLFFDPVMADRLDEMGIDMMMGESAAKIYMTEAKKFYHAGDYQDTAQWWTGATDALRSGDMKDFVFNMPANSLKLSFSKAGKSAPASYSLTNFVSHESVATFIEKTGIVEAANEFNRNMIALENGSSGVYKILEDIFGEEIINSSNPQSLAAAAVLVRYGSDSTHPVVRNYALRLLTDKAINDNSKPVGSFVSRTMVYRPDDSVSPMLYAENGSGERYLHRFGGIKVSHGEGEQIINPNDTQYAGRIAGRDFAFRRDEKGRMVVIDPEDGKIYTGNELKKAGRNDEYILAESLSMLTATMEAIIPKMPSNRQMWEIVRNEGYSRQRLIDMVGDPKTSKMAKDLMDALAVIDRYNVSTIDGTVRIPRKSVSDVVIARVEGYYGADEGNYAGMSPHAVAVLMNADFDVDTVNTFSNLPANMLRDYILHAGSIGDSSSPPETQTTYLDMFSNGFDRSTPAGMGRMAELDGMTQFKMRKENLTYMIGKMAKFQGGLTAMNQAGFKFNFGRGTDDVKMVDFNSRDEMRRFNIRFASIMQAALDPWKTTWQGLMDKDIIDKMMFGGVIKSPDNVEYENLDLETREGVQFLPAFYKNGSEGTKQADQMTRMEKDVVSQVYKVVNRIKGVFKDTYDNEGGTKALTIEEMRVIKTEADRFFSDPSAYVFKKLFLSYSYQIKTGGQSRAGELQQARRDLIDVFFGRERTDELESKIAKVINDEGGIDFDVLDALIKGSEIKRDVVNASGKLTDLPEGAFMTEALKNITPENKASNRQIALAMGEHVSRLADILDDDMALSMHIMDKEQQGLYGGRPGISYSTQPDPQFDRTLRGQSVYYDPNIGLVQRFIESSLARMKPMFNTAEGEAQLYGAMDESISKMIDSEERKMDLAAKFGDDEEVMYHARRATALRKAQKRVHYQLYDNIINDVNQDAGKNNHYSFTLGSGEIKALSTKFNDKQYVYRVNENAAVSGDIDSMLEVVGIVTKDNPKATFINRPGRYVVTKTPIMVKYDADPKNAARGMRWEQLTSATNDLSWLSTDELVKDNFVRRHREINQAIQQLRDLRVQKVAAGQNLQRALQEEMSSRAALIDGFFKEFGQNDNSTIFRMVGYLLRPHMGNQIITNAKTPQLDFRENVAWQKYLAEYVSRYGGGALPVDMAFGAYMRKFNQSRLGIVRDNTGGFDLYTTEMAMLTGGLKVYRHSNPIHQDLLNPNVFNVFNSSISGIMGARFGKQTIKYRKFHDMRGNDVNVTIRGINDGTTLRNHINGRDVKANYFSARRTCS